MEKKVFEFEQVSKLKSYIDSAITNTVVRISTAQKGSRNLTLSSRTYCLASAFAGARIIYNDILIDDLTIKSKLILAARSMDVPLPENEIQNTVVNSYHKGINNPKTFNPDKFDKKMKVQIRLIGSNLERRFMFKEYSSLTLRKANREDIANIEKLIKKRYSFDTLEKLGVKISEKPFGMVFSDSQMITYNPANKDKFIVVEGRTDFVTAVELGLDKYFGLISRFQKPQKLELGKGIYYFILDKDDSAEHIQSILRNNETIQYACIRPPQEYKDLSEWYFEKEEILGELKEMVEKAELAYYSNASNHSNVSNHSNHSNAHTKKENYFNIKQGNYLLETDFGELEYVVDGFLPIGYSLLGGRPKTGKSYFVYQLILSVCNGTDFLNKFNCKQASVLYFALEDSERRLKNRANKIRESKNELSLNENFYYSTTSFLLDDKGFELLKAEIMTIPNLKVVIIDTMSKVKEPAKSNNLYDNDYAFGGKLQALATELNISIITLTHLRKRNYNGKSDDVFQDITGSTGVTAPVDVIMVLEKGNKDERKLFLCGRDMDETTINLSFKDEFFTFEGYDDEDPKRIELIELWKPFFIKAVELKTDVKKRAFELKIADSTFYNRVKRAKESGIIIESIESYEFTEFKEQKVVVALE